MIIRRERILNNNWILAVAAVFMVLFACNSAMAAITWSVGDAINTPEISDPSAGDKFGMSSEVDCTCNTPTDSDDWCDGESSGSTDDAAIEATLSDGGAGGSWKNGDNTGTSVTYITPSNTGSVTLTVTFDDAGTTQYDDDGSSKTDTVSIEVVNIKMIFKKDNPPPDPPTESDSVTRAGSGSFEVVDGDGDEIVGATYENWAFDGDNVDTSDASNTSSTWSGTIVDSGTASCDVTVAGSTASVSKTITVNARSEWSMNVDFHQDNETSYGEEDFPGASATLGMYRDAESDESYIIGPRSSEGGLDDAYERKEVPSGPNKGIWYVENSSVAVDTESVINMWLKEGKTGFPPAAGRAFHEENEYRETDANGLLTGIINHEGNGSGNGKGHHALAKAEIDTWSPNPAQEIEDNVAVDEDLLIIKTNLELLDFEIQAKTATSEINIPEGSNFGKETIYFYNSSTEDWDPHEYGC